MTISCDPGLRGAFCAIGNSGLPATFDMPTVESIRNKKKRSEIDCEDVAKLLHCYCALSIADDPKFFVEKVGSMPGQGVSSTFAFARATNLVIGIAYGIGYEVVEIPPVKWKKHFGLIGKPKDAARLLAIKKWPELSIIFSRKRDCGRADAALLGLYAKEVGL